MNRRALAAQRSDLDTIWMKIGHWLSTHPPIAHRLAALQPSLAEGPLGGRGAAIGAVAVLVSSVLIPTVATVAFVSEIWPRIEAASQPQQEAASNSTAPVDLSAEAEAGILSLVEAAESYRAREGGPTTEIEQLYQEWSVLNPQESAPVDPYDGQRFGYEAENGEYTIWSSGRDPDDNADNLYYSSQNAAGR